MIQATAEANTAVRNAFSLDVEDYFMVLNFQRGLSRERWKEMPARVAIGTDRVLEALDRVGAKGTFFILGCVAREHPDLVRRIAAEGHEIASHGWSHAPLFELDRVKLFGELHRSKELLEDLSGQEVIGFRAPSFSVRPDTLWALDVLLEAGYRYDSSVFPVRHPDYGIPTAPLTPHRMETPSGATIAEFPMTVARFLGRNVPVSGGGYFRLLPYGITRWGLAQVEREGRPAVFYLHPWELDPDQPDLREHTSRLGALRHYTRLSQTESRLERLLGTFRFTTVRAVLEAEGVLAPAV